MILLNFFCLVKNSSLKILCVIGFDWQMEIFFFLGKEMEILNTPATQCTYPSEYFFSIKKNLTKKIFIYVM